MLFSFGQAVSDLILNSSNPVIKGVVDNAGLAVAQVNKLGDSYTPFQIIAITAGSTYLLNTLWNFYQDLDQGNFGLSYLALADYLYFD